MASEIKANKISPATDTDFTFGDSGDTFTVPSGATIVNSGTATGFGKVLQCIMDKEVVILSTTDTSWVDLMTVTITPDTSSSRFLLMASTNSHSGDSGS